VALPVSLLLYVAELLAVALRVAVALCVATLEKLADAVATAE
jgi:hypothetical protein